jgi:hypothetical protein
MRHSDGFFDQTDTAPAELTYLGCRPNATTAFVQYTPHGIVFLANRFHQYDFVHCGIMPKSQFSHNANFDKLFMSEP